MIVLRLLWVWLISILGIAIPLSAAETHLAPGHVPKVVKRLKAIANVPPETPMKLAIGLPLNDGPGLANFVQELYTPGSANYRRFLTSEQITARFGPTESQFQAVMDFAASNKLHVARAHQNRLLLDVTGSTAEVEKAFGIHLRKYHRPGGDGEFFAPDAEPSVSGNVPILDISGLSDYRPPRPLLHQSAANVQPQAGSGSGGSYIGNDFRAAYVPDVSLTGAGQTLGLLEFDGFYSNDITRYAALAGLPAIPVQTILLDGYSGAPTTGSSSGNSEVSLDIEMAMAMAPGLSKIIVYEAGPTGLPNDALNSMATNEPGNQLSSSWSWSGGPTATTDEIFLTMAAQGQSFFTAAGDSDAYSPGAIDDPSNQDTPADNPYITVVGGTTLTTSGPGGAWISETVWNWNNGTGSSGGTSSHYSIPAWQQGVNMTVNGGSSLMRNIPDIALTGNNVLVAYGNGESGIFGGTSCAAPLWAAFMALVNQQAAVYGDPPIGFINPAIYAIGAGSNYSSLLHDITTGNNTNGTSTNEFYATAGYDLCSGWGTPAGASLINALAAPSDPMIVSPGTGFTSIGLTGGPFSVVSETFTLTNSGSGDSVAPAIAPPPGVSWALSNNAPWLTVSTASGNLQSGGPSEEVTMSLNAGATNLAPGIYIATVWFTNIVTGFVSSREFILVTSLQVAQNNGFEAGSLTSWSQSGNTAFSDATTTGAYVHSGSYGAQFGPSGSLGYLSQPMPTIIGQPYLLSFWITQPEAGTPNQFTASWNGTSLYNQTNLGALGWTNLRCIVIASTTNSILQFGFRNDPSYFGLDDVSVTPLVRPTLQQINKSSATAQFDLSTTPGVPYQAQYTTNLLQGNWIKLGPPFTATNSATTITDTGAVDTQRFYRVVVAP